MKKLNAVNNFALTKMSKALSSWRTRVKKLIEDDKSPEEIWNKERVNEEDLRIFRGRLGLPVSKKMSEWGRVINDRKHSFAVFIHTQNYSFLPVMHI